MGRERLGLVEGGPSGSARSLVLRVERSLSLNGCDQDRPHQQLGVVQHLKSCVGMFTNENRSYCIAPRIGLRQRRGHDEPPRHDGIPNTWTKTTVDGGGPGDGMKIA